MAPSRSILSLPLPKTTIASLTAAGYETLKDLSSATVDGLAQELRLSHEDAEQILATRAPRGTMPSTLPPTQSAAVLAQFSQKLQTGCQGLDDLLKGGVQKGHILELSGPPGTPKEVVVMKVIEQFANDQSGVLIADCQNMINRRSLMQLCRANNTNLSMRYTKPQTLPQFILFIEQLPTLLGSSSNEILLVLSSVSTLFQTTELSPASRTALLQKLKQALARLTISGRLTVIITCQLATKLLNSDGSPGTFDTGARGIMVPQLGSTYLPSGKSWRVLFSPDTQSSGHVSLLSSPNSDGGSPASRTYSVHRA